MAVNSSGGASNSKIKFDIPSEKLIALFSSDRGDEEEDFISLSDFPPSAAPFDPFRASRGLLRDNNAEFRYGWHGACINLLAAEDKPGPPGLEFGSSFEV